MLSFSQIAARRKRQDLLFNLLGIACTMVGLLTLSALLIKLTGHTPSHPIGIAYEPGTSTVWVACYSGEILVYRDA